MSPRRRRFRLTIWPATRLSLPPLWTFERYALDPARGLLVVQSGEVVERQLNGQTVLKLLTLDLDDPEAICAFVNRYGPMRASWCDFDWLPHYLETTKNGLVGPPTPFSETPLYRQIFGAREGIFPADLLLGESVEEFRFGASCLIMLTQAWRFLKGEINASEASSQRLPLVFPQREEVDDELVLSVETKISVRSAEGLLRAALNSALEAFAPRILPSDPIGFDLGFSQGEEGVTRHQKLREPEYSLYTLCCLELFNHIASGTAYRECAADDCAQLFFFQEGRAEWAQYRRDSKYCSPTCKNRQAQRNRRRRLRENQSSRR